MLKGCGIWFYVVVAIVFGLFCLRGGCGNPFA